MTCGVIWKRISLVKTDFLQVEIAWYRGQSQCERMFCSSVDAFISTHEISVYTFPCTFWGWQIHAWCERALRWIFLFSAEATSYLQRYKSTDKSCDGDGRTHLEVSALGLQPVVDKALRISGETQHELSLGLQLVNGLDGFMDLWEETAHQFLSYYYRY